MGELKMPIPEAEGLTQEQMLREQAEDYAAELTDLAASSDASMLTLAVPQIFARFKKEVAFLGLEDTEVKEALISALADRHLDPALASGESNIEIPAYATAALDAVRALPTDPHNKRAA